MIRQPSLVALARGLNLVFFLATSIYCLLTYNPFTYEQFITPHVSAVLTNFAVWHPDIHLFVLSVTVLTVAPYLERSPARWLGWTYLAGSVVLAVWFFMNPVWLLTARSEAVLPLAIISAFPPVWLAFFDHVAVGARPMGEANDRRIWVSCFAAALFVWMTFAAAAPLRLRLTGGIDVSRQAILLATGTSAVSHFVVFTIAGLMLTAMTGISALTRSPGKTLYWGLAILSAAAMTMVLLRVVLAPISITGPVAWLVSVALGVSFAAAWSGIAHHRAAGLESMPALDAWLLPIGPRGSKASIAIGLFLVPIVVQLLVARIATFDWEFMLQKLVAAGAWLVVFACTYRLSRERVAGRLNVLAPLTVVALFAAEQMAMPRVAAWTGDVRLNPEFALDGYAPLDPSFRLTRQVLGSSAGQDAAAFYAYLKANSTIQDARVKPVDVSFAASASQASSGGHPPHIFLFIVDSLRPDYLRPYNGNVSFTPSIAAFGEDSFVFARTFSRYGGTGLAVPSIWAGAMLIHKQYVTPFASTNALEKLVDAHGYRRFISEDHISDALFPPNALTVGLDHNGQEMLHTMCGTTAELAQRLRERPNDGRPIFAMTRPLELHIGNIATATTPAGESYPEFYGPYAARVKRIDGCFGTFIDQLKELHLYDNSIVVLTADHGDSLGEGQRWGHGFTVFPEVLRIPLIVHVPPDLRSSVTADLTRVSFATDITPTLYSLVNGLEGQEGQEGQEGSAGGPREESESASATGGDDVRRSARASRGGAPRAVEKEGREGLLGESLFVRSSVDLSARRRGAYLVASSYGAVYGLLSSNGRRLYIADAIEGREYLFDLVPGGRDARAGVTDAERARARHSIREQIAALAAWYQFTPGP